MALTQVQPGMLASDSQYTGFKNRIINGAMVIDQRNAGAATANTISGYTLDRWQVLQSTTGKLIVQQNAGAITPPAGFTNYLGITSQSAYSVGSSDYFLLTQYVEGYNMADFAWGTASAQTVTLSFWVRSSLTGTFGGALINGAYTYSYPFTYTISSANTWEQKTITITGPTAGTWLTTNGSGIQARFTLGAGSTQVSSTINQWVSSGYQGPTGATSVVGTNAATFYITGVQLEKGSTATSFDYRPYGTELQLCQRYYWSELGSLFASGISYDAAEAMVRVQYGVTMRTSPTVTIYDNSNNAGKVHRNRVGDHPNAVTLVNATANGFPSIGSTGFTVGAGYSCKVKADAEL